jgi:glycosyltransferase involved in cell wall biosynthesis
MKIMWICGNPGLFRAKSLADGGWIGALQQELQNIDGVELINVFEYNKPAEVYKEEHVTYYPIYFNLKNKVKRFFSFKSGDCFMNEQILRIIEKEQPDIVQCWGSELGYGLIAPKAKCPIILHIQGLMNPYLDAYFPPGYSTGTLLQASGIHLLTYLQDILRPYLLFRNFAKREKQIFSNMPIVLGRTAWDKECASILAPHARYLFCSEALRPAITSGEKWKPNKRKKLIVSTIMSGAIYKGADVILRTAALLKQHYGNDFEWNIYGVNEISLHEHITRIKAKDVSVFPKGRISANNLATALRESDVYCHLSYIENSPNSVCEAQYIGVPVVAAMTGGVDTLLKDGAGVLVPSNDAYRTAYAILRIKEDNRFAQALSQKEISVAEPRHDNVSKELYSIYHNIVNHDTCKR